jgi:hypothetical protein
MANAWREHVKKTMAEMKSKARGTVVMLRDVLKVAGKTYKKPAASAAHGKTHKKKATKKRRGKSAKKH